MKSRMFIFCASFVLICSCLFAETQTAPAAKKSPVSADDFKSIIKRYYDAWNTLDLDQPAKFYSKKANLVFYDIAPLKYNGWQEYRQGVENLLKQYSSLKLVPNDDLKVGRVGNVAWTSLTFHLLGTTKDGKSSDVECRHTAVWEKMHGEWLVVHEHVSAPIGAGAQ